MCQLRERYGSAFTVDVPIFGKAVVISDPAEVKQLFTTSPEIADNLDLNLGRVLGPNSFFALNGYAHKKRRPCRGASPSRAAVTRSRSRSGSGDAGMTDTVRGKECRWPGIVGSSRAGR
jgi:cytochrome P450